MASYEEIETKEASIMKNINLEEEIKKEIEKIKEKSSMVHIFYTARQIHTSNECRIAGTNDYKDVHGKEKSISLKKISFDDKNYDVPSRIKEIQKKGIFFDFSKLENYLLENISEELEGETKFEMKYDTKLFFYQNYIYENKNKLIDRIIRDTNYNIKQIFLSILKKNRIKYEIDEGIIKYWDDGAFLKAQISD